MPGLEPADFDGGAGKLITTVVKDERVTGNACAGGGVPRALPCFPAKPVLS